MQFTQFVADSKGDTERVPWAELLRKEAMRQPTRRAKSSFAPYGAPTSLSRLVEGALAAKTVEAKDA